MHGGLANLDGVSEYSIRNRSALGCEQSGADRWSQRADTAQLMAELYPN